jgi:hypothetical protein
MTRNFEIDLELGETAERDFAAGIKKDDLKGLTIPKGRPQEISL